MRFCAISWLIPVMSFRSSIVEGLAQRIAAGDVPSTLADRQVIALDIAAMVAGSALRGEFEQRLTAVLEEIVESGGRIIVAAPLETSHLPTGVLGRRGQISIIVVPMTGTPSSTATGV